VSFNAARCVGNRTLDITHEPDDYPPAYFAPSRLLTGKYRRGQPLPASSRAAESEWLDQPDDALFDRLEQFESEAQQADLKPAQYALRWLLDQPGITAVVLGVKRIDQLAEATVCEEEDHE
jgi:aryl-alcohol dehydrogenase-like predicted oxidoreductase